MRIFLILALLYTPFLGVAHGSADTLRRDNSLISGNLNDTLSQKINMMLIQAREHFEIMSGTKPQGFKARLLDAAFDSSQFYFPLSEEEYIPADADFDLIKDRMSCIENIIPLNYNERVHAFVNYFAVRNRPYTRLMLERQHKYFPIFEHYLKKYGLPEELKYLSIIESGLEPKAVSRARAVGLWQFMSPTGRSYKLHQDWYVDERMDPHQSTEAACKYLKFLYNMFGDWELALAAYNSGPGNVRKAIRRSGYKKTFWEVYPNLLRETRSYVPQFVAIVYVMKYAHEHNLAPRSRQYLVHSDTVHISQYTHLETLATQLNLCLEDLLALNPAIKRGAVPDKIKNYPLRIPAQVYEDFTERRNTVLDSANRVGKEELAKLARSAPGSTYGRDKIVYRVRRGDVLGTIARRYRVRVSDIRRWNNLRGNMIRTGQRLRIWLRPGRGGGAPVSTAIAKSTTPATGLPIPNSKTHQVQSGDTLWSISRRYKGLSIQQIKSLNNLKNNKIKPGQKLIIG